TIIELLIVCSIISILSLASLPKFTPTRVKLSVRAAKQVYGSYPIRARPLAVLNHRATRPTRTSNAPRIARAGANASSTRLGHRRGRLAPGDWRGAADDRRQPCRDTLRAASLLAVRGDQGRLGHHARRVGTVGRYLDGHRGRREHLRRRGHAGLHRPQRAHAL